MPCLGASGVVAFALLAAACGGGGSPGVANVASPATTATTTESGPGGGASAQGGTAGGRVGGGAQPLGMMVGNAEQGTRFSACMREHGEPNFPDPTGQGQLTVVGIDQRSPKFTSALSACRKLLPNGFGQAPTAAQLAQVQQQLLAFSKCMRAHGIKDFPDPSNGGLPRIQPRSDLDPSTPQFRVAYKACKGHVPAGVPDKALGGLAPPTTKNSSGGG